MKAIKLTDNVFWVGARDPELRVFDIIMETKYGTTYNSYLIKGQKNILIETVKAGFSDEYLNKLEDLLAGEKLDYLIVNHTEPDHSGSVRNIITKYPNIELMGTKAAYMYLKAMLNEDVKFRVVADGEELKLGDKTLSFIMAPFLHWPDTMFTYLAEENILFSGDVFGCHFCTKEGIILDRDSGDFMDAFKYYFDVIMGPYKVHVIKALDKIKDTDIRMICTTHGPVLTHELDKYMDLYREWSQEAVTPRDKKYIVIGYVSAYGFTRTIAETLHFTLNQYDDVDVDIIDLSEHDISDIKRMLETADGILIGSPTINQDALKPVWDSLAEVCPVNVRGKLAAAFGSYGWSGEAVKLLEDRLRGLKFKVVESGLRFNFTPSDEDLEKTSTFAGEFAEMILK
ncbi:MAG: FprA family A-type flavoprotein [Clostridia bacterium]|jgi:flavorubredoxin|nr:FprA family A-type flavoprotein [Clostridia bacterium]